MPDSVSESVLDRILEEDAGVKHVINTIKSADILIHGMGEAFVMAKKRGVSETLIQKLKEAGAEGEALGQYFDLDGKVVYSTDSLALWPMPCDNPYGHGDCRRCFQRPRHLVRPAQRS